MKNELFRGGLIFDIFYKFASKIHAKSASSKEFGTWPSHVAIYKLRLRNPQISGLLDRMNW
jgi:hypothetical protein